MLVAYAAHAAKGMGEHIDSCLYANEEAHIMGIPEIERK